MITKVYVNSDNTATLVCPECQKAKIIDVSKYLKKEGPAKIKFTFKCRRCWCGEQHATTCDGITCRKGNTIVALLERRRHFRKKVSFPGKIWTDQGTEKSVQILDLSKKGLLIRLMTPGTYEAGEILTVSFKLDDPQRSKITKQIIIRKIIAPDQLGTEFTGSGSSISNSDGAIGFYLMS